MKHEDLGKAALALGDDARQLAARVAALEALPPPTVGSFRVVSKGEDFDASPAADTLADLLKASRARA